MRAIDPDSKKKRWGGEGREGGEKRRKGKKGGREKRKRKRERGRRRERSCSRCEKYLEFFLKHHRRGLER